MAFDTNSLKLVFKNNNDHDNEVIVDHYPDTCPVCEQGIEVKGLGAYGKSDMSRGHHVQAIFQCPRFDCQTVFIGYYTSAVFGPRHVNEYVFLRNCFIRPFFKIESFDQEIEKLSPKFVDIYTQSKMAEETGLNLICGAGYRKALEFLVKDYLFYAEPTKKKDIIDHSLGYLIANEVDSQKVKFTAGLAKDAGNDETHYAKKMEELTLEDFKKLIKLTTHWISDELTLDGYLKKVVEINSKDKN